jgi:hypothetical protein
MSTSIAQETGTEQDLSGLLQRVGDILAEHPAGGQIVLMVRPVELVVPDGYALVQVIDSEASTVTLELCPIGGLTATSVLYDAQVLPTGDPEAGASKAIAGPYCAAVGDGGGFAHMMAPRVTSAS